MYLFHFCPFFISTCSATFQKFQNASNWISIRRLHYFNNKGSLPVLLNYFNYAGSHKKWIHCVQVLNEQAESHATKTIFFLSSQNQERQNGNYYYNLVLRLMSSTRFLTIQTQIFNGWEPLTSYKVTSLWSITIFFYISVSLKYICTALLVLILRNIALSIF